MATNLRQPVLTERKRDKNRFGYEIPPNLILTTFGSIVPTPTFSSDLGTFMQKKKKPGPLVEGGRPPMFLTPPVTGTYSSPFTTMGVG